MEKTRNRIAIRLLLSSMVFLSLILFSQGNSSAETLISSPIPSKGKGFRDGMENWYVGAGYFEKKSVIRVSGVDQDLDEDITHLYGVLGYTFSDWTEAYLRVGTAEFNIEGDKADGAKLFGTLGMNLKWYKTRSLTIWSSFQGNYYYPQKWTGSDEQIELKTFDLTVAPFAADYRIPIASKPELLAVYGGILARYTWAEAQSRDLLTGETFPESTIRNTSNIGIFAGLRFVPVNGLNINLEGQYIERFSYGLNLVYAFPVN